MHSEDEKDLQGYIRQLQESEKGRNAIRHILGWLDDDGVSLDYQNQDAIQAVIALAFRYPGSTRDAMRLAIGE